MKLIVHAIFFCLFMLFAQASSQTKSDIGSFDINKVAQAVGNQDSNHSPENSAPSHWGKKTSKENWVLICLRIGLYLAVTIAALFLVIWGIKRLGLAGRSKMGGGSMDILEALPLGQNRNMLLVRVVDKVYLIGQTPTSITVLETMEGQKAIELISTTKGVVSIAQFKDVFNNFMGKLKK